MEQQSKKCPHCSEIKIAQDFYYSKAQTLSSYCKKCSLAIKRYRRRNKLGYYKEESKNKNLKLKLKIINHYSDNGTCEKCGFRDWRALSIDHIAGNGAEHRKTIPGNKLYRWLIKNNFPAGFQILCMNCQFIKRHENKEWSRTWNSKHK